MRSPYRLRRYLRQPRIAAYRLAPEHSGRARKGWAQRAPDPDSNDKRVRLVHLTAPGRQAAKQVSAARAERFGQLLDAIEESKRPQVLEALHLLKDAANAIH